MKWAGLQVTAVAQTGRTSGAAVQSRKLYANLPAKIVSAEKFKPLMVQELLRSSCDIYHIQYEYQTFGNFVKSIIFAALLTLVLSLRRPVVITLHGVITLDSVKDRRLGRYAHASYVSFTRSVARVAKVIIVANETMRSTLERQYRVRNISVIPLGTDSAVASFKKETPQTRIVFYGFVRPSKGLDRLLLALRIVQQHYPEIGLTIVGGLSRVNESGYMRCLQEIVAENSLGGSVEFINRSLSLDEKRELFSRSVSLVLPYTDRFVEESAVVHEFAGYDVPLICTPIPRFNDLIDGFDCIKARPEPDELARAIMTIIKDPKLGGRLAQNLKVMTSSSSWIEVAKMHMELYERIIESSTKQRKPKRVD